MLTTLSARKIHEPIDFIFCDASFTDLEPYPGVVSIDCIRHISCSRDQNTILCEQMCGVERQGG
jgi:hypothetical protein